MHLSLTVREIGDDEIDPVLDMIREIFPDAEVELGDNDRIFVAESFGEMVGFAHVVEDEKKLILQGLGVEEDSRDRGIGTALMEKVSELAECADKPVFLKVKGMNPAIHLYERFGFYAKRFGAVHILVKKVPS